MAYNVVTVTVPSASGHPTFPQHLRHPPQHLLDRPKILEVGGHRLLLFYPLEMQKSFHEAI